MSIQQLEYLVALARERHFGRAAAACHVSQPTLSVAIRKLEHELDVVIVLRGQRFEGFTAEGQRVITWAHRILAERSELLAAEECGIAGTITELTLVDEVDGFHFAQSGLLSELRQRYLQIMRGASVLPNIELLPLIHESAWSASK